MAVPSMDRQFQLMPGQKRLRQQHHRQQQDEYVPTLSELGGCVSRAVAVDERVKSLEKRPGEIHVVAGDQGRDTFSAEVFESAHVLQSSLEGRIAAMERAGREQLLNLKDFSARLEERVDWLEDEHMRTRAQPTNDAATAAARLDGVPRRIDLFDVATGKKADHAQIQQEGWATLGMLPAKMNGVYEDVVAQIRRLEGMFETAEAERAGVDEQLQDMRTVLNGFETHVVAAALNAVEARADALGKEVAAAQKRLEQLEASATTGEDKVKGITEAMRDKVDVDDMRDLVNDIAQTTAHSWLETSAMHLVSEFQRQLSADIAGRDNPGFARLQQLSGTVVGIQAQLAGVAQSLDEKASAELLQSLNGTVTRLQDRFDCLQHQSVQDGSGGTKHALQLRVELSELRARIARCESSAQQKAEARDVQQLRESVTSCKAYGGSTGDERVPHLEAELLAVRREMASLERALQGKVDIGQMPLFGENSAVSSCGDLNLQTQLQIQQLRGAVTSVDRKLANVDQSLEDKATNAHVAACRRAASNAETKVSAVEQLIHDKADATQLNQLRVLLSNTQAQVATIEQTVAEKTTPEDLQDLRSTTTLLRAEIANVEQALHDKMSTSQAHALKASVVGVETRLVGVEQAIQDKACDGQVQQIRSAIVTLQAKVAGLSARERSEGFGSGRLRLPAPCGSSTASCGIDGEDCCDVADGGAKNRG
eukprot:TRINITY_DN7146_c0_g2_i1.p1 TRINITY_DN7146_c0_g2~~TRINITY_DN7146_c0_g2_i1.p1  ORF type:complete len:728 (+),score=185.71 TRINITY_DN7146_c0_g2_i1:56-2185(+)